MNFYMIKLALINLRKKGRRTRLSLFATILSTAIIFCSSILYTNVVNFSQISKQETAKYHYVYQTNETIQLSSRYEVTKEYKIEDSIYTLENSSVLVLKEGHYPQTENELCVSHLTNYKIGDFVDGFKIVGIYIADELFMKIHHNQEVFYTNSENGILNQYYIYDKQVYLSNSFMDLLTKLATTSNNVYTNDQFIQIEIIQTYLQNTQLLKLIYIVIIFVCILVSLISIHNVMLISDQQRKREIGLLKSVGASHKNIFVMLSTELIVMGVVGALIGLVLGVGLASFILNQFIVELKLVFHLQMVTQPICVLLSAFSGLLILYSSGMVAYYPYFKTTPIEDLKEVRFELTTPKKNKPVVAQGFGWQMFCIYNRRMKKQTQNIRTSFILLILTSVMFLTIVFSTTMFRNQNTDRPYDILVKKVGEFSNPKVYDLIDQMVSDESLGITNFEVERLLEKGFRTELKSYDNWNGEMDYYKANTNTLYYEATDLVGDVWVNVYHYPTALDKKTIEKLKPYLIEGTLDNLSDREVIAIYKEDYIGRQFCDNFTVGDIIGYAPWYDKVDFSTPKVAMKKECGRRLSAIVVLPYQVAFELGYPFNSNERIFAFDYKAASHNVQLENISFVLKNKGNSVDIQNRIEELLMEVPGYIVENNALEIENNRFSAFIMEVLLYPLFLMLFMISLMNISNVFSGNLILKQNDIAILRCVGIGKKQLSLMVLYEYLEGYINAAFLLAIGIVPLVYLLNKNNLLASFDLANHIAGATIFATCIFAILLVGPFVLRNIKQFCKIEAIDALKDL